MLQSGADLEREARGKEVKTGDGMEEVWRKGGQKGAVGPMLWREGRAVSGVEPRAQAGSGMVA